MEKKRRCGWLPAVPDRERVVWARKSKSLMTCPKSYITALSLSWIDQFQAWKLFGLPDIYSLPARQIDAFCVLENELRLEVEDARG